MDRGLLDAIAEIRRAINFEHLLTSVYEESVCAAETGLYSKKGFVFHDA